MRFAPQPLPPKWAGTLTTLAWPASDGAPVTHAVSLSRPDRATCGELVPYARLAAADGILEFRRDAPVTCGRCLRRLAD